MLGPGSYVGRVRFEEFEMDLCAGELRQSGRKIIQLPEQSVRILSMLLERPGEVITRDEIRKKLWPNDTIVEFGHSINAAMNRLRQALGDSAENPHYIETLARRGYRWRVAVEVEWVDNRSAGAQNPSPQGNLIGRRVSHYRVLEILGGGGMGVVYTAEDLKLGRRVALKFLPEDLANDPLALGRFEREARAASALEHPNICPIYEFGEHDSQPFIVMPLLHGKTLRECIEDYAIGGTPFQTDQLLDLAIQIAEGLGAAHQKGIIHRDIKPANIFITNRGEARILDFGLAKLVESEDQRNIFRDVDVGFQKVTEAEARPSPFLSRTGRTMGTASYMSPEQVRGEKVDTRTDLFSFGVVLYEMATGKQAFPAETMTLVREGILHATPAPAQSWNSDLPSKLEDIISRALEKDRSVRYQTASEMCADLRSVATGFSEAGTAQNGGARRWWSVGFAGVFALLVVTTGVFWFATRQPSFPHGLPELKQRQLTANSSENAVVDSAISPDGKYLAYADKIAIHIRLIETGETQTIQQPQALEETHVDWSPGPWFPDSTRFFAMAVTPGQHPSVWAVSLMGGAPRKLRDDAFAWSISPDSAWVAFTTNTGRVGDREIWLMKSDGGQARKLYETDENSSFERIEWSPDGRRLAYFKNHRTSNKFETVLESRDLYGGPPTRISSPAPWDFWWLMDGRMILSLADTIAAIVSCTRPLPHCRLQVSVGQS